MRSGLGFFWVLGEGVGGLSVDPQDSSGSDVFFSPHYPCFFLAGVL